MDDDSPEGDVPAALETLAVHAATAIEAARLHEQTAHLAATDALTGLPNRRQLEADLALEATASARYQRPFALLMIDVDHFKAYNDEFGHQAGDVALQSVATVLSSGLRSTDLAYRFGGEEFALILRETSAAAATVLADRLRAAVEHRFAGPGERRAITVSVGVAGLPDHGPTPALLVEAADQALYAAKGAGRNRVEEAPPRPIEVGWSGRSSG
jgi:diguanylate cyclase (GGDEF)-like protein